MIVDFKAQVERRKQERITERDAEYAAWKVIEREADAALCALRDAVRPVDVVLCEDVRDTIARGREIRRRREPMRVRLEDLRDGRTCTLYLCERDRMPADCEPMVPVGTFKRAPRGWSCTRDDASFATMAELLAVLAERREFIDAVMKLQAIIESRAAAKAEADARRKIQTVHLVTTTVAWTFRGVAAMVVGAMMIKCVMG